MKNEPPFDSTRLKLLLPPKVWLHGSQSINTGGSAAKLGLTPRSIAWFEVIIRWVLMTPFGVPVEPEVNRSLAIVSGPAFASVRSTSAPAVVARIVSSVVARWVGGGFTFATISTSVGTAALIAAANGTPSSTNTRPGVNRAMIVLSLAKSLATSE